jgi:hypothetical protein
MKGERVNFLDRTSIGQRGKERFSATFFVDRMSYL